MKGYSFGEKIPDVAVKKFYTYNTLKSNGKNT